MTVKAIEWREDGLWLLDQRKLPLQEHWMKLGDVDQVVQAIKDMVVRGAPAIGIAAAYGVVIAAADRYAENPINWRLNLDQDIAKLALSRPTAVNLFWALEQMKAVLSGLDVQNNPASDLLSVAQQIHAADIEANHVMGQLGADLIASSGRGARGVITHCNTGSLATGGYGTALGVIRSAWARGLIDQVYVDETRPWWQGARLTAWELMKDGIPATLHADSVAATLMKNHAGWVVVGADRITARGDVANKIGTYSLAVLARYHGVQFMVVAPTTTFDLELIDGAEIPIEERGPEEVVSVRGQQVAPAGVAVYNPVFDVTPAELIDAIVTEKGVIRQPSVDQVKALFATTKME